MKRIALVLMLASLLALGGQAFAEMCTIDAVPAASLLLPYFEVDFANNDGVTTLFSINNASAAAALTHVTLWTDWSQPSIDFDVFLTGYDVVTVNLRDVFNPGNIPPTADDQSDGGDAISPHGSNPAWDASFTAGPDCINFFPFFVNPVIQGDNLDRLQLGHTGQNVNGAGYMGSDQGDGLARGYITIDNVNECSTQFPSDPGYFVEGGQGVASNINQLWGDYFIIDPANSFAFGDNLVHIEAEDGFNTSSNPPATGYTFYGRYTFPAGSDNREPLGTTWAARYLNVGAFTGGTDMIAWRDSTTNDTLTFYGTDGPSWYPMNETEIVAFDEEEQATELCFSGPGGVISPPAPGSDPTCLPLETQKVATATGDLASPYESGWYFLNLNIDDVGVAADVDFGANGDIAQSFVAVEHSALGQFTVGLSAIELTSACDDLSPLVTDTGNFPSSN